MGFANSIHSVLLTNPIYIFKLKLWCNFNVKFH